MTYIETKIIRSEWFELFGSTWQSSQTLSAHKLENTFS